MSAHAEAAPPPAENGQDTGRLDGASRGRILAVLAVIILFAEAVPLQFVLIGPAVRQVGETWPTVGSNLSWMIIILGLVGGATTPLVGKLADLYGKRRIMLLGSITFLAGSILCATTDSWSMFLVGRALQASCFATTAIAVGLIRDLLPHRYVPVAIGAIAAGFGLSGVAGPLIGGALTDAYSWRALFWFLVVYVVVLIPVTLVVVPESKVRAHQRLDWVGAILAGAGVAMVLMYLSNGQAWGWGRPSAWGYLVVGMAVLVLFYTWETRTSAPMMDPKLLRSPKVAVVLAIAFLANIVIGAVGYAVPYMAQSDGDELKEQIYGGAAAQAGVPVDAVRQVITFDGSLDYGLGLSLFQYALYLSLGAALAAMAAGPLGGLWGKRTGLRAPYIAAMAALTTSTAFLAGLHGAVFVVLVGMVVYSLGNALYSAAANNLVIEAVPRESSGIGVGMLGVFAAFGSSVGTAVVTAVASTHPFRMTTPSPTGQGTVTSDVPSVYTDAGWSAALWATVAFGAVGIALAVVMRTGRTPATGGVAADAPVHGDATPHAQAAVKTPVSGGPTPDPSPADAPA